MVGHLLAQTGALPLLLQADHKANIVCLLPLDVIHQLILHKGGHQVGIFNARFFLYRIGRAVTEYSKNVVLSSSSLQTFRVDINYGYIISFLV